jgi:hypothetical protein
MRPTDSTITVAMAYHELRFPNRMESWVAADELANNDAVAVVVEFTVTAYALLADPSFNSMPTAAAKEPVRVTVVDAL